MLTFEEFFQKKKINLALFRVAEPGLFAEFSSHYPLMGEKSFDHTKKYWFNKLRRNYPFQQEAKPHAVKAEAISEMAIQGVASAAAQNLDKTLEKPKFKEDHLAELVDENVSVKEVSLAEEEITIINSEPETPTSKSAFKPRFNAKNIVKPETDLVKIEDQEKNIEDREPKIEPSKPVFKPKFNMQNIKKTDVKEVSAEITSAKNTKPENENPELERTESAKPAFKPKFNMQNIKKMQVKEVSAEITSAEITKPENEKPEPEPEQSEPIENKEAKPVYKPRFQMKNMPKPAIENSPKTDE